MIPLGYLSFKIEGNEISKIDNRMLMDYEERYKKLQ